MNVKAGGTYSYHWAFKGYNIFLKIIDVVDRKE
jgi:hypothetical protein